MAIAFSPTVPSSFFGTEASICFLSSPLATTGLVLKAEQPEIVFGRLFRIIARMAVSMVDSLNFDGKQVVY